ncbi:alpha/beta hydrolase [Polaribacter aestuariivivens]|uniref:Alpha/beta hydrolase n=1 Tax=Polaribacter aestuariivivens TaxID=2304626 RepID=A0A5S3N6G2_9FLAO|nr:alpha/beta hydrolase [Polaribacter aestuariivivens]TMM28989.1 alpha/beta hydrolase [Polaribacter aestuariivivens]
MIRIITYLAISILGVFVSNAQIKSEEITINNQAIQLPGTLTFSEEKTPLIIWVHGSGNVDRNGNQAGTPVKANYIKQFRDAVNKNNIAFFSYDKRTANSKNKEFLKDTQIKDFVFDAQEVINHFKNDKRFTKIILVGHSQGSLIAMFALENVDKYISIAGTGEAVDKTIVKQIGKNNPTLAKAAQEQFDSLRINGKISVVNPFLISVFAKPNQPFLLSWMQLNPIEEIKKIEIPTLIINGDKDLQVSIEDAKRLNEANKKAELVIIENMNHVLKNIENDEDNMKSYYSAAYPISKKLIETIVQFVKK